MEFSTLLSICENWPVSLWDRPMGSTPDRSKPMCSNVNMGMYVKAHGIYDRDHSLDNPTRGKIVAYSDEKVLLLVQDYKTREYKTIEMDRPTFEKEWTVD